MIDTEEVGSSVWNFGRPGAAGSLQAAWLSFSKFAG